MDGTGSELYEAAANVIEGVFFFPVNQPEPVRMHSKPRRTWAQGARGNVATSKQDAEDMLFAAACERVEVALKERATLEEVTYVSVEGLPFEMQSRIRSMYEALGWTVTYENCAGEYKDLWFS
jgi:hypothetical protein